MSEKREGRNNCPNCGAPIDSDRCPYCGTRFIDFAAMSFDEPFYMRIKHRNQVITARVMLREFEIEYGEPTYIDFADDPYMMHSITTYTNTPEIKARFSVIRDGDAIYRKEVLP